MLVARARVAIKNGTSVAAFQMKGSKIVYNSHVLNKTFFKRLQAK